MIVRFSAEAQGHIANIYHYIDVLGIFHDAQER